MLGTAAALVAAAAGCSSSGSGSAGGSGGTGSGGSAPTVTVGMLFPYSGPAASYGALFNKAVQAGMEVVKDRYGTAFTLKTVQGDSQNTAQGATTAMTALASVDNAEVVLSLGHRARSGGGPDRQAVRHPADQRKRCRPQAGGLLRCHH